LPEKKENTHFTAPLASKNGRNTYSSTDIHRLMEGFMKYAAEISSAAMTNIQYPTEIGSNIHKLMVGDSP
jgi:hypothetical protein